MRHVNTLSTIYIFHSKLPKTHRGENRSKVGPLLSIENSKLPTKSSFVEKNGQNWYYIIQKIIERSILASHMQQCLLQKQTSHRVAGRFNAIQHKGDILPIRTCGEFYVSFVYWHYHEQSTCRIVPWIFWQSILSTIDSSTRGYSLYGYVCALLLRCFLSTGEFSSEPNSYLSSIFGKLLLNTPILGKNCLGIVNNIHNFSNWCIRVKEGINEMRKRRDTVTRWECCIGMYELFTNFINTSYLFTVQYLIIVHSWN